MNIHALNVVTVETEEVDEPAERTPGDDGSWYTPELHARIEAETAEIDRKRAAGLPDGCTPWEVIRERTRRVLVEAGVPGADSL